MNIFIVTVVLFNDKRHPVITNELFTTLDNAKEYMNGLEASHAEVGYTIAPSNVQLNRWFLAPETGTNYDVHVFCTAKTI